MSIQRSLLPVIAFLSSDCQSDHEVPYADIVISVRGVSTPELRGLAGSGGAQGGGHSNLRAVSSTAYIDILRGLTTNL